MTTEQFIYWLQGFLEISNAKELNETQTQIIRDHIGLVLAKQTPDRWNQPTITITPPYTPPVYPHLPNQPLCETGEQTFCHSENQWQDREVKDLLKKLKPTAKSHKSNQPKC